MKKNVLYITALILGSIILNSCNKDWLDVKPKGTTLEANYYKNADEAFTGVVSCYDPLGTEWVKIYASKIGMLNSASDECSAGGASVTDIPEWQVWSNYTLEPAKGPQANFWGRNFTGINRTNTLLSKLDAVTMDASLKARFLAETKFLRAYYYFDLVRLFKNVPLITSLLAPADFFNVEQASPEAVYAQIEKDLTEAIPDLPEVVASNEGGRATKMAAVALLGKVILWQNDNSRMMEAAELFEQVNTSSNYQLLDNYADIFRPDNKFNAESIFEISYSSVAVGYWNNYGVPVGEGLIYTQLCGPRGYSGPTYKAGWGFNPINLDLVGLLKVDPRYKSTVLNIDSLEQAGVASYEKGYENTGYFIAKWAPMTEFLASGSGDPILMWPYNYIEIRLADTYLMEAEALVRAGYAGRAQQWLDAVRARVGLPSVPATLDNIYKERRLELATEGHRWFDLVRTGKAAEALQFKGFVPGKHEVLPIPLEELNNTKLKQNEAYL
jgi:hypothetical protein